MVGVVETILAVDVGGTKRAVEQGLERLREMLPIADRARRAETPASELVLGLQCGGSDAWSGVTSNPALGDAVDRLVALGGTAILSETPEIYGAEHLLYARASAFAFLSEYEGFGLTPLEAMRHRLPTVVLDTPVAREVYGAGARYVAPADATAVADALVTLLRDPGARAAQCAAGDAAVARYRWADTARQTWEALSTAAGRRRA